MLKQFTGYISKTRDNIKAFLKTGMGKFTILSFLLILLSLPLLFMVLGFDSIFIKSTVKGRIHSTDGSIIAGAEITIQGTTVISDEDGYFIMYNLEYGKWNLRITANGYEEYKDSISLERFTNNLDFTLVPLDYGVFKTQLQADTGELMLDKLSLFINDQEVLIAQNGSISSEKFIVGQYELKISSPNYKDETIALEIKNGINKISPIKLVSTEDIALTPKAFITGETIKDYEIDLEGVNYQIDDSSVLNIWDIPISADTLKFTIKKEGYTDRVFDKPYKQGANTISISLFEDTKLISSRNGNIYYHSPQGKNATSLTTGLGSCTYLFSRSERVFVKCLSGTYAINTSSSEQSFIYGSNYRFDAPLADTRIVIVVGSEIFLADLTAGEIISLHNADSAVTSLITLDENNIVFTTVDGVFRLNASNPEKSQLITNGSYRVVAARDKNKFLVLNFTEASQTMSTILEMDKSGSKNLITAAPSAFTQVAYSDDYSSIFTLSSQGDQELKKIDLSNLNSQTLLTQVIGFIKNGNALSVTTTSGVSLIGYNMNIVKTVL